MTIIDQYHTRRPFLREVLIYSALAIIALFIATGTTVTITVG